MNDTRQQTHRRKRYQYPLVCTPTVKLMSSMARHVLYVLLGYASPVDPWCHPKQKTIAERVGVCTRTVKRAVAELVASGLIATERTHRAKSWNRYGLTPYFREAGYNLGTNPHRAAENRNVPTQRESSLTDTDAGYPIHIRDPIHSTAAVQQMKLTYRMKDDQRMVSGQGERIAQAPIPRPNITLSPEPRENDSVLSPKPLTVSGFPEDPNWIAELRRKHGIDHRWPMPILPMPALKRQPDSETLSWLLFLADALCVPSRPPEWARMASTHLTVTDRDQWRSAFEAAIAWGPNCTAIEIERSNEEYNALLVGLSKSDGVPLQKRELRQSLKLYGRYYNRLHGREGASATPLLVRSGGSPC